MSNARIIGLMTVALTLSGLGPASAGSQKAVDPSASSRAIAALAANGAQNVPDLQGCVRWCERDLNPCDPPEFKRTDGRCGEP